MRAWLLSVLIDLLVRHLRLEPGPELSELDEKKVRDFLSTIYTHPYAELYFKYREQKFLYALGGGIGMRGVGRDDYLRIIGQRFEAFNFYRKARRAYELRKEELRRKHTGRNPHRPTS